MQRTRREFLERNGVLGDIFTLPDKMQRAVLSRP